MNENIKCNTNIRTKYKYKKEIEGGKKKEANYDIHGFTRHPPRGPKKEKGKMVKEKENGENSSQRATRL